MAWSATGIQTLTSKQTPQYYADFVIANLFPNCFLRQLGTQVSVPANHGTSCKIPRFRTPVTHAKGMATISANPAVIRTYTEATDRAAMSGLYLCAAANVSGTMKMHVGVRPYNDAVIQFNAIDFIPHALESLTKEAASFVDSYIRGAVSGTAYSKLLTTSGSKATTSAKLGAHDIAAVAARMDAWDVGRFDDDCFVAVANPLTQYELFTELCSNGWNQAVQFGDPDRLYKGEIGKVYGVRFLVSSAMKNFVGAAGTSATVGLSGTVSGSNTWFIAPDAFYSLEPGGGGADVIHHPPGNAGSYDPANNFGSLALKFWYGVAPGVSADYKLVRYAHPLRITF